MHSSPQRLMKLITMGWALSSVSLVLVSTLGYGADIELMPINMSRIALVDPNRRLIQATDSSSVLGSATDVILDGKLLKHEKQDAKAWVEKTFPKDGRFICLNSNNVCFRLRDWDAINLDNEKILIYGNEINSDDLTISILDTTTKSFSPKAYIKGISMPTAVALDGGKKVLITGGSELNDGRASASAECNELIVEQMRVVKHKPLQNPRKFHSAIEVFDHRVIVVGGEGYKGELIGSIELIDNNSSTKIGEISSRRNPLLLCSNSDLLITGGWRERDNIFHDERWVRDAYLLKIPVRLVSTKIQH